MQLSCWQAYFISKRLCRISSELAALVWAWPCLSTLSDSSFLVSDVCFKVGLIFTAFNQCFPAFYQRVIFLLRQHSFLASSMIPGGIKKKKITVPRIYPKVLAITLPANPVSGGCHLPDSNGLSLVLFSALELAEEDMLGGNRVLAAPLHCPRPRCCHSGQ